jgi:predicted RNA-binding protein with EMAP domain
MSTYAILSLIASIPSVICIFLLIKLLKLKNAIKTLSIAYSKIENLSSLKNNNDLDNDVHKESFIKFLSDSRDWAYTYIEDIQQGLTNFVNDVEPEISHFDEYGEALSMSRPDYDSMKNISRAYKELKKLLPIEEKQ